jgi:hypothetical protein
MAEKTTWEKTKEWAKRNPTATGAISGFGAGSVLPGLGSVAGLVAGGVIGFLVGQEQDRRETKTAQIDKPKNQEVDKAGSD